MTGILRQIWKKVGEDELKEQTAREWKYEDIVDLPHHVSRKHPQMSLEKRAAQFAPFAALTGYDEVLEDAERQALKESESRD